MDTYSKLSGIIKQIKDQPDDQLGISFYTLFIFIKIMPILMGVLFIFITKFTGTELAILIIPILFGGMIISAYISQFLARTRLTVLIGELEKFNIFWKENISNIQNIEEILSGISILHEKISKITILNKYALDKNSIFMRLQKIETEYFIEILTDLRSDLQFRLTEQQSTLESAKSEVEKNIAGTTELNQVSELQKARLDKQIEQFEELQRVLVKV